MKVEQMVGQRIRERREALSMTQLELGKQVGPMLGKTWSRQAVSLAESGQRAFTASELFAVAAVLKTRPAHLITPPLWTQEVELSSGKMVPVRDSEELPQPDEFVTRVMGLATRFVDATTDMRKAAIKVDVSSKFVATTLGELVSELDETFSAIKQAYVDSAEVSTEAAKASREASKAYEKLIAGIEHRIEQKENDERPNQED